jgi:hypothetical protein
MAVYSAAVRRGGEINGEPLGVLGVFFDWEHQSKVIVKDEPLLSDDEWRRARVMLLDQKLRVIASSDNQGLLGTYPLDTRGQSKGTYLDESRNRVCFARTIGYQEYDGLGWYAVIVMRPEGLR